VTSKKGDKQMPYDYDLENFKKQAHNDAMKFGDFGVEIEALLVSAYLKGYEQCEDDYHTHYGL
jgi:hypothetical protein